MFTRLSTLLAHLLIGLAIPLVVFVGVGILATVMIVRLVNALGNEGHTRKVIILAYKLNQPIERMRAGAQNTFSPRRIIESESYASGSKAFISRAEELAHEVTDAPAQRQRVEQMLAEVAELNHILESIPQPANAIQQANVRLNGMENEIRSFIDSEENLLLKRRETVERQIWQSAVVVSVAVILALGLALGLSIQLARSVTFPVHRLRQAASELVAGRYRSVAVAGPTELADLIVLFNQMALTLTRRTSDLQQQEERYRTYIGAVAHILWTTNAQGEVVADLPTWRTYTGQSEEEVLGRGWFAAIHPEDRAATEKAWQEAVANRAIYEGEFRLRSARGEHRHFACQGVPILTASGEVREWIGTCTDITDSKHQEALRQAKEAAEASNQAKSAFLAKMSHELRTPLNAVIGMSKMLTTERFGPLNAKQADYLGDITRAGEHLLALINDILDLTKVEAGKLDIQADAFALTQTVEALSSTLRPLAENKGVQLEIQAGGNGTLNTDAARLRQILYNLLSNAIKFTPTKGRVSISWQWVRDVQRPTVVVSESEATAVCFEVADTGVGIAPEYQEAIWDEFRQIRPYTGEQEGTGLGLALTRRLVALLGGRIWLKSAPGEGSIFTFVIPRSLPGTAQAEPEPSVEDNRLLALVIEDHGPTNKLLVDWLAEAGMATFSVFDGEIGLTEARRLKPALVVLDIQLPGLDGWQVLTALKSEPATATIPVMIVTVADNRQSERGCAVQEFFPKPIDREHFLQRVRQLQCQLSSAGGVEV